MLVNTQFNYLASEKYSIRPLKASQIYIKFSNFKDFLRGFSVFFI